MQAGILEFMSPHTFRLARRLLTVVASLVAVGTITAAGQQPTPAPAPQPTTLPPAREVVARHVKALGGEAAFKAIKSIHAKGTFQLPNQGISGDLDLMAARPDLMLLKVEIPSVGHVESGYNGKNGWSIDPVTGPMLLTGRALKEMAEDAWFDSALHDSSRVKDMTTIGKTEWDKRQAYQVKVVFVSGVEETEYFDVETGLQIGTESQRETPMGILPTQVMLRKHEKFGGLLQPTEMVQSTMGIDQVFHITSYRVQHRAVRCVRSAAANQGPDQVTRRVAAVAAVVIAASLGSLAAARQAWRAQAVESFDEIWHTIHDTYYDPTFGGLDWDAVRAELRPKVESAASEEDARQVMRDMLARLRQSHFVLMSSASAADALPGEATVPIDVRMGAPGLVVTRVASASAAEHAGLKAGDVILSIDGQTVAAWAASASGRDERARRADVWRRAFRALHGADGTRATLVVRSPRGEERTVTVAREPGAGQVVKLGNLPPLHVVFDARELATPGGRRAGVIHFNYWMGTIDAPFGAAIDRYRHDAGLVIDLRGNSGGIAGMISGIAGQVMDQPALLGNMQMRAGSTHFSANPRRSMPDGRRVTPFAGPVAILVDELTASASECFAGALQSLGRATVFGRPSMGQALPASTKSLPDGDVLMYAVGDFVTATGRRLEGEGVIPDRDQPLSVDALAAGHDLPLEAALAWIDSAAKAGSKTVRK